MNGSKRQSKSLRSATHRADTGKNMPTQAANKSLSAEDLITRRQHLGAQVRRAEQELETARTERETDETASIIEGREPNPKYAKIFREKESALAALQARLPALDRAIETLRATAEEDRLRRNHQAVEKFRKDAEPQLKRLRAATSELQDAALAFFAIQAAQPNLPGLDLLAFLFPPNDIANPIADMNERFAKLSMVSAAVTGLTSEARSVAA